MPTLFDEVLLDPDLITSWGSGSPEFANIQPRNPASGFTKTNVSRYDAVETWVLGMKLMTAEKREYFNSFWRAGYGSAIGFRAKIPSDYTATLEVFAGPGGSQVPNGVLTAFKLYKTYSRPSVSRVDVRRIVKPVVQAAKATGATLYEPNGTTARVINTTFRIYFNTGAGDVEQASGWTVNVTTGVVTFSVAPATGTYIKWTGEFDVPMAFTGNGFNQKFDVGSDIEGVGIREILYTELGIAA